MVADWVSVKFYNFKIKISYGLAILFHFLGTSRLLHLSCTSYSQGQRSPGWSHGEQGKKAALSQDILLPSAGGNMPHSVCMVLNV